MGNNAHMLAWCLALGVGVAIVNCYQTIFRWLLQMARHVGRATLHGLGRALRFRWLRRLLNKIHNPSPPLSEGGTSPASPQVTSPATSASNGAGRGAASWGFIDEPSDTSTRSVGVHLYKPSSGSS